MPAPCTRYCCPRGEASSYTPRALPSGTLLALCVTGFVQRGPPENRITSPAIYRGLAQTNDKLRKLGAERVDVFFELDLTIYPQSRLSGVIYTDEASYRCAPDGCREEAGHGTGNMRTLGYISPADVQPAIDAVGAVSVGFGNSTFCKSSPLCNAGCSPTSGAMPHLMWEQYAKLARAFAQVVAYERRHGIRYTWIGMVRSDWVDVHWTVAVVSAAVERASSSDRGARVFVTGIEQKGQTVPEYGMVDHAALVPRANADAYFLVVNTSCEWLRCVHSSLPTAHRPVLKSERLLAEHILRHGLELDALCANGVAVDVPHAPIVDSTCASQSTIQSTSPLPLQGVLGRPNGRRHGSGARLEAPAASLEASIGEERRQLGGGNTARSEEDGGRRRAETGGDDAAGISAAEDARTTRWCTAAIVVRGPSTPHHASPMIKYLLASQPPSHCIVYTHFAGADQSGPLEPSLRALEPLGRVPGGLQRFAFLLSKPPCVTGSFHRNSNKLAIVHALALLRKQHPRCQWVLHTRADLIPRLPGVVDVLKAMAITNPLSDARGDGPQRHRLITSSRTSLSQVSECARPGRGSLDRADWVGWAGSSAFSRRGLAWAGWLRVCNGAVRASGGARSAHHLTTAVACEPPHNRHHMRACLDGLR